MSLFIQSQFVFNGDTVSPADRAELDNFDSLLQRSSQIVSQDRISSVGHFQLDKQYYLKIYTQGNGRLRDLFQHSRFDRELYNLKLFSELGIPTPKIIAYGRRSCGGRLATGLLLTEGISDATPLNEWGSNQQLHSRGRDWLQKILRQLADYTRRLHEVGFIHVDLKWRNILLSESLEQLFFIDCPSGYKPPRWVLEYLIVKDLACLDREGKLYLSRSERLYLYKQYCGIDKLRPADKKRIAKIQGFFPGHRRKRLLGRSKQLKQQKKDLELGLRLLKDGQPLSHHQQRAVDHDRQQKNT